MQKFKEGLLTRIKEEALRPTGPSSGFNKIVSYFDGTNPAMSGRIFDVLGEDDYYRLANQVNVQNVVNKAKALNISDEIVTRSKKGIDAKTGALLGGGAATVLQSIPAITQTLSNPALSKGALVSGAVAATGAGLAGLYKIAGMFHDGFERAVATRIANALASQDPAAIAALNKIPPKALNQYLTRFSYFLEGAGAPSGEILKAAALDGKEPKPPEAVGGKKKKTLRDMLSKGADGGVPLQNAGGRVERKSGGRIGSNSISAEVRKVRALLSQKTASMLSMPDDAIATALHIAKGK
jgi:hypothetical protein